MNQVARRAFLRGMGAAPLAAKITGNDVAAKLTGVEIGGMSAGSSIPDVPSGEVTFKSFASWFNKFGQDAVSDEARVDTIDVDLVCLSLPLTTIFRMQYARNYRRALARKRRWFDAVLATKGKVEWWP